MNPDLKARFDKLKLQTKEANEKADKSLESLGSTIEKSKNERMKLIFSHLCETSGYLRVMYDSVVLLLKKRQETIPAMHEIADKFEKMKDDKNIADTVGKTLGIVGTCITLSGVGAPLGMALSATSAAIQLGTELATHCLGNAEFEKFSNIINDDNCTSDLFSKATVHLAHETKFFEDNDIHPIMVYYLINELKISKYSNYEEFILDKTQSSILDLFLSGEFEETNFEDLSKTYNLKDYCKFGKKTVKIVVTIYKICKELFGKSGGSGKGIFAKITEKVISKIGQNNFSKMSDIYKFGKKGFAIIGIGLELHAIFNIWFYNSTCEEKIEIDDIADNLAKEEESLKSLQYELQNVVDW
jgi:hypothetical protein